MNEHCEHCGNGPLTRDDVLQRAYDFLTLGAEHITNGRATEATVMNSLAQTALMLANQISVRTGEAIH